MIKPHLFTLTAALSIACRIAPAAPLPFAGSDNWNQWISCQGYNTQVIDHVNVNGRFGNNGLYALDFVLTDPIAASGPTGCGNVSATSGKQIISPASGLISRKGTYGACLKLDQPVGNIKSLEFYHIVPDQSIPANGTAVSISVAGAVGKIQAAGTDNPVPHLHLAAFKTTNCDASVNTVPFNDFFDGYNLTASFDSQGTPTPLQKRRILFTPHKVPTSELTGTGSVIDPDLGGTCTSSTPGCFFDIARLAPKSTSSSVAFQVLAQSKKCQNLEISHQNGSTAASYFVSVKQFDESYPGAKGNALSAIYRVTALPARVALPPNKFMVVKVTSTAPLTAGSVDVVARCVEGDFVQALPGTQITKQTPPTGYEAEFSNERMADGSFWGGAASLIGYSGNNSNGASRNGFTKTKDDLVSVPTRKDATVSLQAYRSRTSCKKVRLENASGKVGDTVELRHKLWNAAEWIDSSSRQLPTELDLPGDGFWVIKARVVNTTTVRRLLASCLAS